MQHYTTTQTEVKPFPIVEVEKPTHKFVKYKNRKVYSKKLSRYVNTVLILKLFLEGTKVSVLTKEGEDVTGEVMLKALSDNFKEFNLAEATRKLNNYFEQKGENNA